MSNQELTQTPLCTVTGLQQGIENQGFNQIEKIL